MSGKKRRNRLFGSRARELLGFHDFLIRTKLTICSAMDLPTSGLPTIHWIES